MPVSPRYRQPPLRTPPFHRLPGDDTSSGTTTDSPTAYLGDANHRPSFLAPPHTDRTQTTGGPSAFFDRTVTDDLSDPSSPAPRRPVFGRHRLSLAHLGSLPRPTVFQGSVCFCVYLFCAFFFSRGETSLFADRMFHRQREPNGFLFRFPTPFPFLKAHL